MSSKYDYSKEEKIINSVLNHHAQRLSALSSDKLDGLEERIHDSENILGELGYALPSVSQAEHYSPGRSFAIKSWEDICKEANSFSDKNEELETLFSQEELAENAHIISYYRKEYAAIHRLDKTDIAIFACAALLGAAVDILLVGIPKTTPTGVHAGKLSDYIRKEFDRRFPASEMEKLANSKVSKVPYDAQDNRNTRIRVEGLSSYYHRLLSLGHDPLLGLIFGVADIMNGTMTTIDKSGAVLCQIMDCYADRTEKDIFAALAKQIIHFKSDITTSMGLPAPMMALFNMLQFGSIGEYEQTIAEIVQGMYYEGYDFIHFCSMSLPTLLIELVVRLCYAIKRIKEGFSIKDSIPFSTDREKHPKLRTMLFSAHAAATAINAGKVYFSNNPMAINYSQWLAFSKYSFQQLRWLLLEKPESQDLYVTGRINEEFSSLYEDINEVYQRVLGNEVMIEFT